MVAVTELVAGSRSEPFSSRDASTLIVFEFGFGGGESVKVAEIFCSSSSSTLARSVLRSGELMV